MPLIRAQVVLPFATNIPEDVITNTLWFGTPNGMSLSTSADLIAPNLLSFYNAIYNGVGIAYYVNRATAHIKFYDWADPEPRQPEIRAMALTSLTQGVSHVPTEVACVLSFHGEPQSGVPAGRMRGRIYIGALTDAAILPSSATAFPSIILAMRSNLVTAGENLLSQSAADDVEWVVYSKATGGLTPWYPVVGGWIDNSPDTQRRRSVLATSRTLWPD